MLLPVPSALDQGKGLATPGPLGQSGHARQKIKIAGDRPVTVLPDGTLISPEPPDGISRIDPAVISHEPVADLASFNEYVVASGVLDTITTVVPLSAWVAALPVSRITVTAEAEVTPEPPAALQSREPEEDHE